MTAGVLTLDKLMEIKRSIQRDLPRPIASEIIITVLAREPVPGQWNFPPSRHRSARLHKKLLRRFGTQERMKPAVLRVGDRMLVHPALWGALKAHLDEQMITPAKTTLMPFGAQLFGIPVRGA